MIHSPAPDHVTWDVRFSLSRHIEGRSALAGIWKCDGSVTSSDGEEVSSHHQIWLQRVGSRAVEVDGCRMVADPASVVFHNPGQEYRTRSAPGLPQASTVVWIREAALLEILAQVGTSHAGRFPSPIAPLEPRAALAHYRLRTLLEEATASPLAVEEASLQLAAEVLGGGHNERGTPPRRAHRELVHSVQELLARRFRERILIEDIARGVGSSPFHLSRVFSRDAGIPIHRYLTRLRLFAALEQMADGERDLSRVGLDAGFSSHSHFTTAFRREFGCPPHTVRALKPGGHPLTSRGVGE